MRASRSMLNTAHISQMLIGTPDQASLSGKTAKRNKFEAVLLACPCAVIVMTTSCTLNPTSHYTYIPTHICIYSWHGDHSPAWLVLLKQLAHTRYNSMHTPDIIQRLPYR